MLLFDRYEYNPDTDLLGEGGFSKVFRAFDTKLKRPVALKFFSIGKTNARYDVISEIERVIQLDHPNICRYYDTEEIVYTLPTGEKNTTQVAVLELLTGGDLQKYFQPGSDKNIERKLLSDVLRGLAYLHENHIIHRDIKPQNILIKETINGPVGKIVDFGISKNTDSDQSSSSAVMGSIEYMAPEQFNPEKYGINGKISTNVDLWQYGMMTYELVSGKPLFGSRTTGDTTEQVMSRILSDEIQGKLNLINEPYRSVIEKCLVKDANTRVQKADELIKQLQIDRTEQKNSAHKPTGVLNFRKDEKNDHSTNKIQTPTQIVQDTIDRSEQKNSAHKPTGLLNFRKDEKNDHSTNKIQGPSHIVNETTDSVTHQNQSKFKNITKWVLLIISVPALGITIFFFFYDLFDTVIGGDSLIFDYHYNFVVAQFTVVPGFILFFLILFIVSLYLFEKIKKIRPIIGVLTVLVIAEAVIYYCLINPNHYFEKNRTERVNLSGENLILECNNFSDKFPISTGKSRPYNMNESEIMGMDNDLHFGKGTDNDYILEIKYTLVALAKPEDIDIGKLKYSYQILKSENANILSLDPYVVFKGLSKFISFNVDITILIPPNKYVSFKPGFKQKFNSYPHSYNFRYVLDDMFFDDDLITYEKSERADTIKLVEK